MSNAEQLITEHIDVWTSAIKPRNSQGRGSSKKIELYGIKKLRELILELAVRGLLVPQDSNDEPASELLKKIASENARLVKKGVIKKQKPLKEIVKDDVPFSLPVGWEWVRLGVIGNTQTGGTPKKADSHHYGNYIPFLKPGDILDGSILSYENDGLSQEGAKSLDRIAPPDSVLMVCIGTIGKCARVDRAVSFNQQINAVTPFVGIGGYIEKVIQSPYFQRRSWDSSSSTTISILNKGRWEQLPIPLAPLEQQHRIVAKVDELMALCDHLEQQQTDSITAHQTLVQTLLDALTNAGKRGEFESAWTRIAQHFDTLFTTEHSIDQLKQTILQLAVMGKLVPQNPNDEPASELLKKIAADKIKLIKEGKIKKQKPLPQISSDEMPFELPFGWEFVRLDDLSEIITKGSSPKWQGVSYTDNPKDVLFVTSENVGSFELKLDAEKYVEKRFNEIEPRSILRKNDILMNIVGASIGRTAIFDLERLANINQAVCLIRLIESQISLRFVLLFFNSAICVSYMFDKQVDNARANLSMGNISKFVIPVPPLVEQKLVVKKVDELMLICDQLKFQLSQSQTTQLHLADAMAEQALA